MTLSIELRNMDNTQTGTNSVGDVANVKVKEIVIVSLILSVWFYSLYRYAFYIIFIIWWTTKYKII